LNNVPRQNFLMAMLMFLLIASTSTYSRPQIGEAHTFKTHHFLERAKFRVLVSKDDLNKGKVIIDCAEVGCDYMEGLYDTDTLVYLPSNKTGSTQDLLNYSGRNGDISIRKIDQRIRRIQLYK